MSEIKKLSRKVKEFRDARDWKQFHNPKDMALSLSLEAAEVLEHFQWRNGKEQEDYIKKHRNEIADELSDVFYWVLLMAHDLHIDLSKAFDKKMKKSARKYPIKKSKGKSAKYTDL